MIIESVSKFTSKTVHVINFDVDLMITVGRAPLVNVRITDISVSRFHSNLIICNDGTVTLTDNFSKFGTLVLLKTPLEVKPGQNIYLQVGRTLLTISSKPRYSCCDMLAMWYNGKNDF